MHVAESTSADKARDERIIAVMREHHVHPIFTWKDEDLALEFDAWAVTAFGLPSNALIRDKRSVSRIEGIIRVQMRDIIRLQSFAKAAPGKVEIINGGRSFRLSSDAPTELVGKAAAYSHDPNMAARMNAAVQRGRMTSDNRKRQSDGPVPQSEQDALLAEWASADRAGDITKRRMLSHRIRSDKKLRAHFDRLDPKLVTTVKEDWRETDTQNAMLAARQSGMGF